MYKQCGASEEGQGAGLAEMQGRGGPERALRPEPSRAEPEPQVRR